MPDGTRAAILSAADSLFREHGFKATTIEDIADRAGIGKGTVYLYFSSKFDISLGWFREMHDAVLEQLEKLAAADGTFTANLTQFLITRMTVKRTNYLQIADSVGEILEFSDGALLDRREVFVERERGILAAWLQRNGASQEQANSLASSALLAMDALQPHILSLSRLMDAEDYATRAESLATLVARGVAASLEVPN